MLAVELLAGNAFQSAPDSAQSEGARPIRTLRLPGGADRLLGFHHDIVSVHGRLGNAAKAGAIESHGVVERLGQLLDGRILPDQAQVFGQILTADLSCPNEHYGRAVGAKSIFDASDDRLEADDAAKISELISKAHK